MVDMFAVNTEILLNRSLNDQMSLMSPRKTNFITLLVV